MGNHVCDGEHNAQTVCNALVNSQYRFSLCQATFTYSVFSESTCSLDLLNKRFLANVVQLLIMKAAVCHIYSHVIKAKLLVSIVNFGIIILYRCFDSLCYNFNYNKMITDVFCQKNFSKVEIKIDFLRQQTPLYYLLYFWREHSEKKFILKHSHCIAQPHTLFPIHETISSYFCVLIILLRKFLERLHTNFWRSKQPCR